MCLGVCVLKINKVSNVKSAYALPLCKPQKSINNTGYNQINKLSNVYYQPVNFGRSLKEHKSWGAQVDPVTKEVTFKIFTYPDSKKVEVTVEKKGNEKNTKTYELRNSGNGIFETPYKIPAKEVSHGDKYYYTIYKGNGDIDKVKDPYSFRQEQLLDKSTIYDHSLYKWNDDSWYKNNKDRISRRTDNNNGLKSIDSAKIYEFNTATLTEKGTFNEAKKIIKSVKEMGFNAIEIMPVENTYSFNWGYDGVDKMAPSEHLGGPDELKSLIDFAHQNGVNVIMDMVPNHLGPDGAALKRTGPYIAGVNDFGEAFNFEGENSKYVRDYIANTALNWIMNYHCDGLRLDMTKYMNSDTTMKQIAAEVNYHCPDAFLIAEDGRGAVSVDQNDKYYTNYNEPHDMRVVRPLKPFETASGTAECSHNNAIDLIESGKTSLGRLGYDSEWDFYFFHTLKDGTYGVLDLNNYEKACYSSGSRVKYVMSHDEIGNYEGTRLLSKLMVPMLHLNDNIILNSEDLKRAEILAGVKKVRIEDYIKNITYQKAQFAAEKLAIMLQEGKLDKYSTANSTSKDQTNAINKKFYNDILAPMGIKQNAGINYDTVKSMFRRSFNKNKMALVTMYSVPGPKMIFQGDEKAELTPFRFFREFEHCKNEEYLEREKGYNTGREAFEKSKLGKINYSKNANIMMGQYRNLVSDLNKLTEENTALIKGKYIKEDTVKHQHSQVFASHIKDAENNNEIFAVTNFAPNSYPRSNAAEYYIKFPRGQWTQILNTDNRKYGGYGFYNNSHIIYGDGTNNVPIKLAGESAILFRRVG